MKRQHGVALIAVMMALAFAVVMVVAMTSRLQMQLQRNMNVQMRQQALWLALGAEEFTRRLLKKAVVGKETVNLGQEWAQAGVAFPVDQATISGEIKDLNSCFNLNSLQKKQPKSESDGGTDSAVEKSEAEQERDAAEKAQADKTDAEKAATSKTDESNLTPAQKAMQSLLENNAAELSMPAEYLVVRLTDWLDADSVLQNAGGAEENDYAAIEFPFYTANSLMVSKSELRNILDMTVADYNMVAPLVCALPENNLLKVNVNTLKQEQAALLSALIPSLTLENAEALIESRPEKGFSDINDFKQSKQMAGVALPEDVLSLLDVKSSYFQADLNIDTADSSFKLVTVFKVDNKQVQVISRRFGGPG